MKAPPLRKASARQTIYMGCDGGINLNDPQNLINDNQSGKMLNMWFYDKALRLRPGMTAFLQQQYGKILDIYPRNGSVTLIKSRERGGEIVEDIYGIYILTETAVLIYDGGELIRVPDSFTYINGSRSDIYVSRSYNRCFFAPAGKRECAVASQSGTETVTGCALYLIGSGLFLEIAPAVLTIGEHTEADIFFGVIAPYTPVIMTDCTPAGDGTTLEQRNFLTSQVKQKFTTDSSYNIYRLFDSALDNTAVTIDYDGIYAGKTQFVLTPENDTQIINNLCAVLNRTSGIITFSSPLAEARIFGVKNNLTVTYSKSINSRVPINFCTAGEWFGDKQGSSGGIRLFLSGDPKNPAVVFCSSPDDASYFPEGSRLTAGDPSEPVTALVPYLDILAVLKINSVYSLCLQSSGNFNLTLKTVNSKIGCDMPKSVQTIGGSLVWAKSDGGVYALESTAIQDERTVSVISSNVNRSLLALGADALKASISLDTGSRYMLFAADNVYVWDYKSAPLSKSGDTVKATRNLAWYIWKLPCDIYGAFLLSGSVYTADIEGNLYCFDVNFFRDTDFQSGSVGFEAYWYSKLQDFGKPFIKKLLYKCYGGFLNENTAELECFNAEDEGGAKRIFIDGAEKPIPVKLQCGSSCSEGICYVVKRLESVNAGFGFTGFEFSVIFLR